MLRSWFSHFRLFWFNELSNWDVLIDHRKVVRIDILFFLRTDAINYRPFCWFDWHMHVILRHWCENFLRISLLDKVYLVFLFIVIKSFSKFAALLDSDWFKILWFFNEFLLIHFDEVFGLLLKILESFSFILKSIFDHVIHILKLLELIH